MHAISEYSVIHLVLRQRLHLKIASSPFSVTWQRAHLALSCFSSAFSRSFSMKCSAMCFICPSGELHFSPQQACKLDRSKGCLPFESSPVHRLQTIATSSRISAQSWHILGVNLIRAWRVQHLSQVMILSDMFRPSLRRHFLHAKS